MYKAMDKGTGEMVAIKIIPICDEDNEDELTKIVREIDHLKKCDSPYVTAYYGSYFRNKRLWVRALLSSLFSFFWVCFVFVLCWLPLGCRSDLEVVGRS